MSYDGRKFRSTATETSAGDDVPIGHYHQFGRLVWAEFAGGAVTIGRLVGHTAADQTITASYVQVLTDGRTVSGEVLSTPTALPDGRLRLCERWRRADGSEGVSWLEEVAEEP